MGTSLDAAARTALGEAAGIIIADRIWSDEVQLGLRRQIGVDVPLNFWDGPETKVFVIMLPTNAEAVDEKGILRFREGANTSLPSVPSALPEGSRQASGGAKTNEEWQNKQHL